MVKRTISHLARPVVIIAGACVLLLGGFVASGPITLQSAVPREPFHRIAPYYPTPLFVAEKMLEVAEVTPRDVVYDLRQDAVVATSWWQ